MATTADTARARIESGANWFYWVAGLSVINTVIAHTDSSFNFIIGLGITQLFDALTAGSAAAPLALAVDALLIGTCVAVGYYARESRSVYVTGMVLYLLDTLLFLVFQDPVGIGFHLFALYCMYTGVQGFAELEVSATAEDSVPPVPSTV